MMAMMCNVVQCCAMMRNDVQFLTFDEQF